MTSPQRRCASFACFLETRRPCRHGLGSSALHCYAQLCIATRSFAQGQYLSPSRKLAALGLWLGALCSRARWEPAKVAGARTSADVHLAVVAFARQVAAFVCGTRRTVASSVALGRFVALGRHCTRPCTRPCTLAGRARSFRACVCLCAYPAVVTVCSAQTLVHVPVVALLRVPFVLGCRARRARASLVMAWYLLFRIARVASTFVSTFVST